MNINMKGANLASVTHINIDLKHTQYETFCYHNSVFSQHIIPGVVDHKTVVSGQPQQCGQQSLPMLLDSRDDHGHGGAIQPELHSIMTHTLLN
jgi:hypothetical protein